MKTKNLIIGGGFAGLYLATQMEDAILIEGTDKLGGLLQSFKSPSGDYSFDIGGHVYTSKYAPLKILLDAAGGIEFPERMAFYDYEKKIPYPIQFHAHELGIDLLHDPRPSYPSLAAMFTHEFGKEFYEKVLKPFNQRVWSTNPNAMDADWVMGRVPTIKEFGNNWGPNASFIYARGEDIIATLSDWNESTKVFTSTRLVRLDMEHKVAWVDCDNGAVYRGPIEYENVYDTTGYVLKTLGSYLPSNRVLTIGVGLNKEIKEQFHWWYNSVENRSKIHRITLLSRYNPKMSPLGADSLLIEMPYGSKDNTGTPIELLNEISPMVIGSLLREAHFYFVGEKDIAEVMSIDSRGYPIPILTHRNKIAFTRREMAKHNVYLVGRWGAHGYYNLDHIIKDAFSAMAASVDKEVQDYYWANYYYSEKRSF